MGRKTGNDGTDSTRLVVAPDTGGPVLDGLGSVTWFVGTPVAGTGSEAIAAKYVTST